MLYYSTGQAARELGVSQDQIRQLCHGRVIKAESTAGGQYRIAQAEVERLKRQGVPPAPRPMPVDPELEPQEGRGRRPRGDVSDPDIREALRGDEVRVHELSLKAEQLRRQRHVNLEQERLEKQQERLQRQKQEQVRAEEARRKQEDAAVQRQQCIAEWEGYALQNSAWAEPGQRNEIHEAVRRRLESLDPLPSRDICERLVDDILAAARRLVDQKRESELAVDRVIDALPWELRSWGKYEPLRAQMILALQAAVRQLPVSASPEEKEAAARAAAQPWVERYRHQELLAHIADNLLGELRGASREELAAAEAALGGASSSLKIGTPTMEMMVACVDALAPVAQQLRERTEREKAAAEHKRRRGSADFKVTLHIHKVEDRLEALVEAGELRVSGGYDLWRTAEALKPIIRPHLAEWIVAHPRHRGDDLEEEINRLVDRHLDEVTEHESEVMDR